MLFWVGFHIVMGFLLCCDFFLFEKDKRGLSLKNAGILSGFWILLALIFNGLIYFTRGWDAALQFLTAYIVEKSLSLDNLFVFLLIFNRFKLSLFQQRKVLFWGILGAIVFRIICILLGIQLLNTLHWMSYVLGAFLCATGIKILVRRQSKAPKQERNLLVRAFSFLSVAKKTSSDFFVQEEGKTKMTLLFVALLMIESTDILFALDSIPAVLAITKDPSIAYTSNIFAILGLRALYFVICPFLEKWKYLNIGLSAILIFVGFKMLFFSVYSIPLSSSLLIIVGILCITWIASSSRSK